MGIEIKKSDIEPGIRDSTCYEIPGQTCPFCGAQMCGSSDYEWCSNYECTYARKVK